MATDVDIVRTLIPDTEAVFGPAGDETMFSNSEIENFLTAGGGSTLRAAALACLAIGTSEAIISKVIKTADLATDGAKLADSFTNKANLLFRRADDVDAAEAANFFQIIDFREGWGVYPPELVEPDISTYWGRV